MIRFPLILCLAWLPVRAAEINAASTSQDDVWDAYQLASNGDTIVIPAGYSAWSSNLTFTKAVSVRGAGTNSSTGTVIGDNRASDSFWGFDQTGYTNMGIKISDIQFTNVNGVTKSSGAWTIAGCNTNRSWFVVSNVFNYQTRGPSPFIYGGIGVFTKSKWQDVSGISTYCYHENWNGLLYSDGSRADDVDWTNHWEWIVFEDCEGILSSGNYAFCDAYRGARYIVRRSTLRNLWLEAHGLDSGGRLGGTRALGSWLNTFIGSDAGDYVHNIRSGTGVCYSNTVTDFLTAANFLHLDAYRRFYTFPTFGPANGTNEWDINAASGPFESGTATSGGTLTMTDTSKSWTVNQWAGYSIINKNAATTQNHSYILSNTSDTITFNQAEFGANLSFSAGNAYEIWRVTESIDQPGRGQGTLLSGLTPSIPAGWNDQVDEPWYEWGNTRDGGIDVDAKSMADFIRINEHYYNDTAKPGWVEMQYPHPFLGEAASGEASSSGKGRGVKGTGRRGGGRRR